VNNRENAFLSKKLATLDIHVDLNEFSINNFLFHEKEILNEEVCDMFESLEFYSLIDRDAPELKTWEDL